VRPSPILQFYLCATAPQCVSVSLLCLLLLGSGVQCGSTIPVPVPVFPSSLCAGSLVKHQLVSSFTLGIALRCVLDALRKPHDSKGTPPDCQELDLTACLAPCCLHRGACRVIGGARLCTCMEHVTRTQDYASCSSPCVRSLNLSSSLFFFFLFLFRVLLCLYCAVQMFTFGMTSLEQFLERLPEWPQYCTHLLQIPHLLHHQPELVAKIQASLARTTPPRRDATGAPGYTRSALGIELVIEC